MHCLLSSELLNVIFLFFLCMLLYVLTYTGVHHDFHIKGYLFHLRITEWVPPLVEQDLLTRLGHLSLLPIFSVVRVAQFIVFCVGFCGSLFVLLSFFLLLAIVLTVLAIRFTDFVHPFVILQLYKLAHLNR